MKKKILCWGDFCGTSTGFGRLFKYLMKGLHDTGKYELSQLAINFFNFNYDRNQIPYDIIPAKLEDSSDPYGLKMFPKVVTSAPWDYIFIINDTFVLQPMAEHIDTIRKAFSQKYKKDFKIIYYYPVDCCVMDHWAQILNKVDFPVPYSQFATEETLKAFPSIKLQNFIYHGVDNSSFFPLPNNSKLSFRREHLKIPDDFFLVTYIASNNSRKEIPRALFAFKEFHERHSKSFMYVHTRIKPGVVDLITILKQLKLTSKEVAFPLNLNSQGYPDQDLNKIYNSSDLFFSTNAGEGFGLCAAEAAAAGTPLLLPDNTIHSELWGGKALLYPCREKIWLDNSGLRNQGRDEDILKALCDAYRKHKKRDLSKFSSRAQQFALELDWENIQKQWVDFFDQLKRIKEDKEDEVLPSTFSSINTEEV